MPDLLIPESIASSEISSLSRTFQVVSEPNLWRTPDRLRAIIKDFRAILIRNQTQITKDLISAAPNLQLIARAGVGLDNVDLQAASAAGIVVALTPDQNAISVAELVIGLMLSLARHIPAADTSTRSGNWERQKFTGSELFQKTLGIVGLGRIGFLTALRARAFGMRILAHDSFISPDSPFVSESAATLLGLDDLLSQSDIISVHVPHTPQTTNLFNAARFARMKPTALFINTSRGEVVHESDLIDALRAAKLAGAALDVRSTEPPAPSPLSEMPNVILTPHIAAFTREAQSRVLTSITRDITAVLSGHPAQNYANFPRPRRTTPPPASREAG